MISIVTLAYENVKHPLDKILDDIPGRSGESIPRNRGITGSIRFAAVTIYERSKSLCATSSLRAQSAWQSCLL